MRLDSAVEHVRAGLSLASVLGYFRAICRFGTELEAGSYTPHLERSAGETEVMVGGLPSNLKV